MAADFASLSAQPLPLSCFAVSVEPSPSFATPMSLAVQWAGIHMMPSGSKSPQARSIIPWTLACLRLSVVAHSTPALNAETHGRQSHRIEHPGSAPIAAYVTAQASVPGMSSTQSGGTPWAAAITRAVSLKTAKAHPFLASRSSGPSIREPSV
jgi:hypothetical protein